MHNGKRWSFILVAAGKGTRLGGVPKQHRLLGNRLLWRWSFDAAARLLSKSLIEDIVVVLNESDYHSVSAVLTQEKVKVVVGGEKRSDSVRNGLQLCEGEYVMIHDAARPFLSEDLCLRIMENCTEDIGVVPVVSVNDSLEKKNENGTFVSVNRDNFLRVQTPQAFYRKRLCDLMVDSKNSGTDEASIWLESGLKINRVNGSEMGFKITTAYDWLLATSIINNFTERRVGHGYDVHKLVKGRKLILAGVEIESDLGLLGHSDADLVTHTIMDAILGAAGEPSIGDLFPASLPKWKDASSIAMLDNVVELVKSKNWEINWVDVTLIAQTPKLGNVIYSLAKHIAPHVSDSHNAVNIKVKSGEECGSVGRSECMVCHAVAEISKLKIDI